jgi:hypothetical protein
MKRCWDKPDAGRLLLLVVVLLVAVSACDSRADERELLWEEKAGYDNEPVTISEDALSIMRELRVDEFEQLTPGQRLVRFEAMWSQRFGSFPSKAESDAVDEKGTVIGFKSVAGSPWLCGDHQYELRKMSERLDLSASDTMVVHRTALHLWVPARYILASFIQCDLENCLGIFG